MESFIPFVIDIINSKYEEKSKRDIWEDSEWKYIAQLENDDVGKVGETIIDTICEKSNITSNIDGSKTKQIGGGNGDGIIKCRTCEIKTARLGSDERSFQHELGETPWKADYMIFLDIAPKKMYVTIFKNFTKDFYESSGRDNSIKCKPIFPTKSITWRKKTGAFKLDTTIKINNSNKNTFDFDVNTIDAERFRTFINAIIE